MRATVYLVYDRTAAGGWMMKKNEKASKSDWAVLQKLYAAQRRAEVDDSKEAFEQMVAAMKEADEWLRLHWKPQRTEEASQ